jgi:hypothetical protein
MGALDLKVVALNRIITSNIMDDMKSNIVGRSWCKLALQMEQWSSRDRVVNRDQQPAGKFSAPTNNRKPSEDNRLLQPLLDSSQGKLHCTTHPMGVERPSTGLGMVVNKKNTLDLGDLDEKHHNEDAQQSQGPDPPNNKGEQFHQSKSPPLINCVRLQPRESVWCMPRWIKNL